MQSAGETTYGWLLTQGWRRRNLWPAGSGTGRWLLDLVTLPFIGTGAEGPLCRARRAARRLSRRAPSSAGRREPLARAELLAGCLQCPQSWSDPSNGEGSRPAGSRGGLLRLRGGVTGCRRSSARALVARFEPSLFLFRCGLACRQRSGVVPRISQLPARGLSASLRARLLRSRDLREVTRFAREGERRRAGEGDRAGSQVNLQGEAGDTEPTSAPLQSGSVGERAASSVGDCTAGSGGIPALFDVATVSATSSVRVTGGTAGSEPRQAAGGRAMGPCPLPRWLSRLRQWARRGVPLAHCLCPTGCCWTGRPAWRATQGPQPRRAAPAAVLQLAAEGPDREQAGGESAGRSEAGCPAGSPARRVQRPPHAAHR